MKDATNVSDACTDKNNLSFILSESSSSWSSMKLLVSTEDIRRPTSWSIRDDRHVVIVHLGGYIKTLETEIEGHGSSFGPANPGELWIIPAGENYASRAQGRVINYGVVYIERNALAAVVGGRGAKAEIAPRQGHRDDFVCRLIERIANVMDEEDDISLMIGETLSQALCLHLFREYAHKEFKILSGKPGAALTPKDTRVIEEYINDNLSRKITLNDIAVLANMTTHNLLVAFRRTFYTTPAQYIISQRLRRAEWLLTNSARDITRIAFETGFASHSHLTATFRKHLDCSPSQFRTVSRATIGE